MVFDLINKVQVISGIFIELWRNYCNNRYQVFPHQFTYLSWIFILYDQIIKDEFGIQINLISTYLLGGLFLKIV